MGARGPAPTPTKIHEKNGSWLAKTNPREPQPTAGPPPIPKGFDKVQKELYRRLTKTLGEMQVLTKADWAQLERYVVQFVRWRKAIAFLDKKEKEHGDQVPYGCYPMFQNVDPADTPKYVAPVRGNTYLAGYAEYPTVRQIVALDKALKQIEANFGLTPSARTRIWAMDDETPGKAKAQNGDDPEILFFNAAGG